MAEEDNSDQITDSGKDLGGAGWARRFLFLGGGREKKAYAETLSAQSRSREE